MNDVRDLTHFLRWDGGTARLELAVEGIHCAGCMAKIERGLAGLPAVARARVNLTDKRVAIEWSGGAPDPARIVDRLGELGFKAYPFEPARAEANEAEAAASLLRRLGVAAFAAMNIMLLSVSVWSGNITDITPEQRDFFHWLSALIALPAAAYAGQPFFRSAVRALKAKSLNMDVPITLGVLLALAMSVFETLGHAEHAYFDSAIMLLAFLLAGRYLDQNMRRRTRALAGNLAALRAETAVKFVGNGEIREVPIASVSPGDLVLVRPGERIAIDGVVSEGRSDVDQSLITGETAQVVVGKGAAVYAGTMNVTGALRVEVRAAAAGTLLDEIKRLLDRATEARSHYVRLADRAARLYAPVVHVTALATLLGWLAAGAGWHDAIITAIAVLIITCPCALGLAVPAVQVVAAGALFRAGVLLNTGDAIERLAEVDTVLFDKTGTLTFPEPEVVNAANVAPEVFALAGRLALSSRHPLAAAIATAAGAKAPLADAVEVAGQGVCAVIDGIAAKLGRPTFCGATREAEAAAGRDPEASLIAFAYGEERHVFAVRQRLRPDAAAVIDRLKRTGLSLEIVSGDRAEAVASVAARLDIDAFRAAMTPTQKIARIAELKGQGRRVLMVGDGLNDAPSLAAAHVSLSPVTAVHLSQATADAVFLGERLAPVAAALTIAAKARRVMRANLWLAAGYNLVAVPLAIFGLASPLVAALAMSGSSLLVTANALRARPSRHGPL
jgi:P-type Cu2+ transporter